MPQASSTAAAIKTLRPSTKSKHKNPAFSARRCSARASVSFPPPHSADSRPEPVPPPRALHSSSQTPSAATPLLPAPQSSVATPPPSASQPRYSAEPIESSAHCSSHPRQLTRPHASAPAPDAHSHPTPAGTAAPATNHPASTHTHTGPPPYSAAHPAPSGPTLSAPLRCRRYRATTSAASAASSQTHPSACPPPVAM